MTFKIIEGDLFDPSHNFSALAQGVNCQGVMGAGIAPKFKALWPTMFDEYRDICQRYGPALTGLLSKHWTPNKSLETSWDYEKESVTTPLWYGGVIYNLFTQNMPGPDASYRQLQSCMIQMVLDADDEGIETIGVPLIGGGLGGLEPHNVREIMMSVALTSEVEVVLVERPNG